MSNQQKVLVIGLDGVPFGLIRDWIEEGHLPHLGRLMAEGTAGELCSTIPPTSGPSWSSFQTGKNPGKTGIYDFLYRGEGGYHFPPVNAKRRDGKTLWSIASEAGRHVGVLNMPMSYPVESINGFMISGWMTPYAAEDFIHPPELMQELEKEVGFYRIYPTATFSEERRDNFLTACYKLLEMRTQTALHLLKSRPWDLFTVVFFDTDRILHQLWHYLDSSHPWRQDQEDQDHIVLDYFQRLDDNIGKLLEHAGKDTLIIILSDHGMGPAHNFVVLNNWLLETGLIKLKGDPFTTLKYKLFKAGFTLRNVHKVANQLGLARHVEYKMGYFVDHLIKRIFLSFLDVDWSKTLAYSFGRHLGSIYLNVKGREPEGIVEPGEEYERVRDEIICKTESFLDPRTNRPLIKQVLKREEIYSGPHFEDAPDLILLPNKETDIFFGLADFGSNHLVDTVYRYSGMHRQHGMLIMHGKGVKQGNVINDAKIIDMAPTILYALGLPIPRDMDGQMLKEVFTAPFLEQMPLLYGEDSFSLFYDPASGYLEEGEKEVMERLKQLGYLG